jgi:hypothetical protein
VAKLDEELPVELRAVRTRPLFVMRLDVKGPLVVGGTSNGFRRIGIVPGGSFEGERLSGQVLDGGSDWQVVRGDGSTTLDVRLVLRTDDDVLVTMFCWGIRHGPREIIERIERGEVVEPATHYFRINPLFEAPEGKYDWLNRVVAVGIGHRRSDGPIYSLFEVL